VKYPPKLLDDIGIEIVGRIWTPSNDIEIK
jgi:hypothetical protein